LPRPADVFMKPRFIDIDGRRHAWADILELRRVQLAA
jgi:hypothetical protein